MEILLVFLIVYFGLYWLASVAINRDRAKTFSERIFWYGLILLLPILGAIVVLLITHSRRRRERAIQAAALDEKMRNAIVEAKARAFQTDRK